MVFKLVIRFYIGPQIYKARIEISKFDLLHHLNPKPRLTVVLPTWHATWKITWHILLFIISFFSPFYLFHFSLLRPFPPLSTFSHHLLPLHRCYHCLLSLTAAAAAGSSYYFSAPHHCLRRHLSLATSLATASPTAASSGKSRERSSVAIGASSALPWSPIAALPPDIGPRRAFRACLVRTCSGQIVKGRGTYLAKRKRKRHRSRARNDDEEAEAVASTWGAHGDDEEEVLMVAVKWSSRQKEGRGRGTRGCRCHLWPRASAPSSGQLRRWCLFLRWLAPSLSASLSLFAACPPSPLLVHPAVEEEEKRRGRDKRETGNFAMSSSKWHAT